jgi:hypothetical protein
MQHSPCWEFWVTQLVNKFPIFYETRIFTTEFTRPRHWSLSWARWIQSTPSLRSIVILSFHLRLGLTSGFPSRFSLLFKAKINGYFSYIFLSHRRRQIHDFEKTWQHQSSQLVIVSLGGPPTLVFRESGSHRGNVIRNWYIGLWKSCYWRWWPA